MADVKIVRRRRKGCVRLRPEVSSSPALDALTIQLGSLLGLDRARTRDFLLNMGPRRRAA